LFGGDEGLADAAREGDDGEVFAGALDFGFAELGGVSGWIVLGSGGAYGNDKVVALGLFAHGEGQAVEQLVLKDDDGVGVADRGLEQALCVLGAVGRDDLETGDAAVPRGVVLRVLGGDTGGEAVGAAEGDVAGLDAAGHVVRLCGGVDDLVNGLHGEVERHELALGVLVLEAQ
jgi:hypothetical protein